MATIGNVRRDLKKAYQRLGSWSRVASEFQINKGMAYRIVVQEYEPKDVKIRSRLGLSELVYGRAPVCPKCGVVHVSRRCTARPAMWMRRVWDTPVGELKWRLENREEF
jgi:hypothetical protein